MDTVLTWAAYHGENRTAANEAECASTFGRFDGAEGNHHRERLLKPLNWIRRVSLLPMFAAGRFRPERSTGRNARSGGGHGVRAIRDYYQRQAAKVGFKAAGGVRTKTPHLYHHRSSRMARVSSKSALPAAKQPLSAIEGKEIKYF